MRVTMRLELLTNEAVVVASEHFWHLDVYMAVMQVDAVSEDEGRLDFTKSKYDVPILSAASDVLGSVRCFPVHRIRVVVSLRVSMYTSVFTDHRTVWVVPDFQTV